MNYDAIADKLVADATTLRDEVATLSKLFADTEFLSTGHTFPHGHYGYIMACMSQIDLMSKCEWGAEREPRGNQTPRMHGFMMRHIDDQKADEHRVAIKLFRHTLMHTGALRPIWEADGTAYTWRVYFTNGLPSAYEHYTLSVETVTPTDDFHRILNSSGVSVTTVKALNLRLTDFSADILKAAVHYTTTMRQSPELQGKAEAIYPRLSAQQLTQE